MKLSLLILILIISVNTSVFSQTNDPDDFRTYLRQTSKLTNERKYDEAIKLLTDAIKIFPRESWLYLRRAEIYRTQKNLNLMEEDIEKFVEFAKGKDKIEFINRGSMLLRMVDKCDKALALVNKAINCDAANPRSFYTRAMVHLCFDDKVAAINDIDQVLNLKPDDVNAKITRRKLVAEMSNNKVGSSGNEDLIASYENKLEISPQNEKLRRDLVTLYMNRAGQFEKEGKLEEMFADFDRAIQILPKAYYIYGQRGKKFYKYKYYEEAIADFRKVIEKNPKAWLDYLRIGDSYYKLGQYERAIEEYKNALKVDLASEKLINSRIKSVEQEIAEKTKSEN